MTTTTYLDANLHHDQVTGRAVTACLHLVNATPSHWDTKDKLQLKLQLLALSLWQQELLQIKLLTLGTHSCILEFQSDQKATCLETTNLWLTVQVFLHLPWHPITESGKLLLQDSSNSTGKMENLHPADILSKH